MSEVDAGGRRERFTSDERRALFASMVGGSVVPLNSTMIAVALPSIAEDTGVSSGTAALLVTSYLVAMLVFQPVGGRLGDRFGSRRVALWAMVAFAGASVVAAAAPTFAVLLVARCLQAVTGSAFSPNLQAIMRSAIAPLRRGRAFGLMGSGIGTGAAVGPVVGGLLVAGGTWRLVFMVNAPVVVPAIVLLARLHARNVIPRRQEARSAPLRTVLLQPPFVAACVTQACGNFAMYTLLLLLPQLLNAAGWSSGPTGFAVSVLTLGMLTLAPVGGYLGDRRGRTTMVVAGTTIAAAGCVVVATGVASTTAVVVGALIVGCGQGLSGASLQTSALEAVPEDSTASAAGFFSTSRYVGSIAASLVIASANVSGHASARPAAIAVVVAAVLAVAAGSQVGRFRGGGITAPA